MEPITSFKSKTPKILIGFSIGLVFSLVVFLLTNFIFGNQNKAPTTQTKKTLNLNLSSPIRDVATSEKTITVSGSTEVKSIVSVNLGKQSKIMETAGNYFSTTLDLVEGKNTITIVAYDPTNNLSQTTTKEILYLNEDLTNL